MTKSNAAEISQSEANHLYAAGNNAGRGYAPDTDDGEDDSVEEAVRYARGDGWTVMYSPSNTSDVAVLCNEDGELMGIGGDGMGMGAWAVTLDVEE